MVKPPNANPRAIHTSLGSSRRFQDRSQALHGMFQPNGSGSQGGLPGRYQGGLVGRPQEAQEGFREVCCAVEGGGRGQFTGSGGRGLVCV